MYITESNCKHNLTQYILILKQMVLLELDITKYITILILNI